MLKNNLVMLVLCALLCACYHNKSGGAYDDRTAAAADTAEDRALTDLQRFEATHHYGRSYNFVVKADSIPIIVQQPEEFIYRMHTDTVYVRRNDHIAVADVRIIDADHIDSVWVQVARDQSTFGWTHEGILLKSVVPSDPISQFISTFSDTHLLIFLIVISIIASSYLLRRIMKKKAFIVHFNDIDSMYPTLLAIAVATAATFYSSIQLFAPDQWQQFYFHPSLNPFSQPPIIGVFVAAVWAMLILCIATIDDVKELLSLSQRILYLCGLAAICAANYIIFSITTLYYVGFPLLITYIVFALYRYVHVAACSYTCGKCGRKIRHIGRCPYCGADNCA